MRSATVSVIGSQENFVGVLSRKRRHLLQALSRKSPLEKKLLIAVLILLLIAFLLIIILLVSASSKKQQTQEVMCETKQCIQSAALLMNSMDTSVDPCVDFYQYACGRWSEERILPDDSSNSWFSERTKYIQREIIGVLSMRNIAQDPLPLRQARILYTSCLDTETLDSIGLQPMFDVLTKSMLPTDIPSSATAQTFQLAQTLALAQRLMSNDILVAITTITDPLSNITMFQIGPSYGISPLPELVTIDPHTSQISGRKLFAIKLSYITSVLSEIESESNTSTLATAALKILVSDTQIKGDIRLTDNDDPPIRTTFERLQMLMDNYTNGTFTNTNRIDWQEYLDVLMNGTSIKLNMSSVVFVQSPSYFELLAKRLAVAKPETTQRLIWWKIVESLAPHTTTTLRKIRDLYLETLFGPSTRLTRAKRCASVTKSFFNMAISYKMATSINTNVTANKVRSMLMDITEAFKSMVKSVGWMNEKTKKATLGKATAITNYIGYPDWLFKPGELEKLYHGLTINETRYLWSLLNIKMSEVLEVLSHIGKPPPDEKTFRWTSDPLEVNAYYSRTINAISIPAGILQIPFYYHGLEALNYGAIGSILGHELTHGFDIEGKEYDAKGQRVTWWDEHMTRVYNNKAKCFVDQYSNYSIGDTEDFKINGSLTLAENIADNGGVREALIAYRLFKKRQGSEPLLPGLQHLNHEQLLFVAFANVWCAASTPTHDILSLSDVHSPNKFRVIGSLSNSPEFSKVWNCPAGSPMNPVKKCILW